MTFTLRRCYLIVNRNVQRTNHHLDWAREFTMKLLALVLLGITAAGVFVALPQTDLRTDVNLVSIYFTVRNSRERLITDLTKDAFKVLEDGRSQDISFFAHHSDLPMNVGVLLDTS